MFLWQKIFIPLYHFKYILFLFIINPNKAFSLQRNFKNIYSFYEV